LRSNGFQGSAGLVDENEAKTSSFSLLAGSSYFPRFFPQSEFLRQEFLDNAFVPNPFTDACS
jgi:hypothetical protein